MREFCVRAILMREAHIFDPSIDARRRLAVVADSPLLFLSLWIFFPPSLATTLPLSANRFFDLLFYRFPRLIFWFLATRLKQSRLFRSNLPFSHLLFLFLLPASAHHNFCLFFFFCFSAHEFLITVISIISKISLHFLYILPIKHLFSVRNLSALDPRFCDFVKYSPINAKNIFYYFPSWLYKCGNVMAEEITTLGGWEFHNFN